MSCLEATFTLTPRSPLYSKAPHESAYITAFGVDFQCFSPLDFSSLYATNRFLFDGEFPGTPGLDYTKYDNLTKAPALWFTGDFTAYAGTQKQLALICGFDVLSPPPAAPARVLVYSDAGLLSDQTLLYGDSQFLIEIDSLNLPFTLYFIHVAGTWLFRGLSGYVV
jgi:hypothetical protein